MRSDDEAFLGNAIFFRNICNNRNMSMKNWSLGSKNIIVTRHNGVTFKSISLLLLRNDNAYYMRDREFAHVDFHR